MAAVTRERSDRMHDIVATIQREQDEIIRAPNRGVLIVTGGPGTGKTAVALHRVAYLLYRHRERLERRGVLVVGPSRPFAEYIQRVLPSLGETRAVLRPLGSFVPGSETDRHDRLEVADVKGRAAIAGVLARHVERLPRGTSWQTAFEQLRSMDDAVDALTGPGLPRSDAELLATAWRADRAAGRPPTVEDIPLLDELRSLLGGSRRAARPSPDAVAEVTTHDARAGAVDPAELISAPDYAGFGHVVVDEAQDLSAMQWRMVARRGQGATWTVVGDRAQRSEPAAPPSWQQVADLLGRDEPRLASLTVNYRTSAPIMALAARLLPGIDPDQHAPRSARDSDREPRILTGVEHPAEEVVAAARADRTATAGTVAVIAPSIWQDDLVGPLRDERIRVLDPWTAKGLEFDAVVVADPDGVIQEAGPGALYVALTRATERLTIVTGADRLPGGLQAS